MNKKLTNYVLNFHEKKLLESGRMFSEFRDNSMFSKFWEFGFNLSWSPTGIVVKDFHSV